MRADADYRTLTVLSSGSYATYRIHCAFENPADAERAVAELSPDKRFPDYRTETLPLMPDGRLPYRVTRYRIVVSNYNWVTRSWSAGPLMDNEVWEWEAPPPVRQLPLRGHDEGAEFTGTDKTLVIQAATAYLAELRKA